MNRPITRGHTTSISYRSKKCDNAFPHTLNTLRTRPADARRDNFANLYSRNRSRPFVGTKFNVNWMSNFHSIYGATAAVAFHHRSIYPIWSFSILGREWPGFGGLSFTVRAACWPRRGFFPPKSTNSNRVNDAIKRTVPREIRSEFSYLKLVSFSGQTRVK